MRKGLVIPCYNETTRLPKSELMALLDGCSDLEVLLVDDGSSDGTDAMIQKIASENPRVHALILAKNMGKAEAVRHGLQHLLNQNPDWVGYADADFATPSSELIRLWAVVDQRSASVVMGSRVRLLGTQIHRQAFRHYLGRVFATFSSLVLRLPVYDTQCGAKLFANTPALRESLKTPFQTRWVFDVELLGRLLIFGANSKNDFVEVPLQVWRDVKGSKLGIAAMAGAAFDLIKIAFWLRGRRPSRARK